IPAVTRALRPAVRGQDPPAPRRGPVPAGGATGEPAEPRAPLEETPRLPPSGPRPVLNAPERIARLSREGASLLLRDAPGMMVPVTERRPRAELLDAAGKRMPMEFPIIVRPIGSHAGESLARIDGPDGLGAYLEGNPEHVFYVAPFIDYRSKDGRFRKYRVSLIGGRPYACHMGISDHWMIHYLNAGMRESAAKRAEEARFMAEFE